MKESNKNFEKFFSILVVIFITVCGVVSIVAHPREIFGGFVRGILNSQEKIYLNKIGDGFSTFDARVSEYFILHDAAVHSYGAIQSILGKNYIHDVDPSSEVVKLKNDYLVFKKDTQIDYQPLNDYLIGLDNACSNNGIDFMYVSMIDKNLDSPELFPDYYPFVVANSTHDDFERSLINKGVHFLNLSECAQNENIDKFSMFFKSDHHWTPQTGIWVCNKISNYMNDNFGYGLDTSLFDLSKYQVITYEKSSLGSQGKRVGKFFSCIDDFDIVVPEYETNMSMVVARDNIFLEGTFLDTMIQTEHITPDNLLNKDANAYQAYMGGNYNLVVLENLNITEGKKCVVVMNSMGCVVVPYLVQCFERVDCIDIRSFSSSVEEYIVKEKPDVVIYMLNAFQS